MTKRERGECPVCCENFTKSSRKPIVCAGCTYEVCQVCAQKYLTTVENSDCMKCHHGWDLEYLQKNFPRIWIEGSYKKHRQDVLFETEKALLPASQHLVQNFRASLRLKEQLLEENDERKQLISRLREIEHNKGRLRHMLNTYRVTNYNTFVYDEAIDEEDADPNIIAPTKGHRTSFIMRCPADECRGFLDTSYQCGTCNMFACSKCMVLLGTSRSHPNHSCDNALVETVKLLKKDTRSCPKCNVGIHKIEGCDQMWCTMCHTPFSYRTGEIITHGPLHNPHMFEWLQTRRGGSERRHQDNDDAHAHHNRLPTIWQFERGFPRSSAGTDNKASLFRHLRIVTHVHTIILGENLNLPPIEEANLDLRRKYLMREIDEETWKRMLFVREKRREKTQAFRDAYTMLVDLSAPIFWSSARTEQDILYMLEELREVAEFVDAAVSAVVARFKCISPYTFTCPMIRRE